MGGVTDTQSLRFGYLSDVISHTMVKDLADDIDTQLAAADTAATAALKLPAVIVRRGSVSPIALPVTTFTNITFDQEQQDTHGMVDIPTQPTRITVSASAGAGCYFFAWQAQCDTTSWTRGDVVLNKNGSYYSRASAMAPQSFNYMSGCAEVFLGTVGDYVSFQIYHEGGGSTNLQEFYCWAWKVSS